MYVREILQKLGLNIIDVELGVVEVQDDITDELREIIATKLKKGGLELIDNKKNILVEKIKNIIVELVHNTDDLPKVNDSSYISEKLNYDYTYLSNTFSEVKGITIQQYIIMHKIERVKELLFYGELTLTEIALKLNYSSVAHLSNQFKKVTGLTPTYFKEMKTKRERNLENL